MKQVQALANNTEQLKNDAINLLQRLISIPSFSKEESGSAECIENFLRARNIPVRRIGNNICAYNKHYDPRRESILLNSHHDTVRPNKGYTRDPFAATIENGKLYGLGSNDAGASVVSMLACFLHYYENTDPKYNLLYVASAEEEISGSNGIELVLKELDHIAFAIVGEPTRMEMAVAEKGLLVLDCLSTGKAGHAARNEGINAIYLAMQDIQMLQKHQFSRVSEFLGPVKANVTCIETDNKTHNIVPGECRFTIDVRVNELYTHEEVLEEIQSLIKARITPRGTRLRSSAIPLEHPLIQSGLKLGLPYYGSPTTSDKALMPFPGLKLGPGDSARSHSADEFICLEEIDKGITVYINILENIL